MLRWIPALILAAMTVGCAGNESSVVASLAPSPSNTGTATSPPPATNTGDVNCVDTSSDVLNLRSLREEVCALVNVERAKVSVAPLKLEATRTAVAQAHADDMIARNFFSHTSPDGDDPSDRLSAAGITWSTWGENIALNGGSAASVVTQWMNSSGHRSNILNPNFGRLGVGKRSSDWVQVFTN